MFHENVGVPIRSSTKYCIILGLVILIVGMGYSVYLYKKSISPPVVPGGTASQQATPEAPTVHTLILAPGGKSHPIPVPFRKRVTMDGKDFRIVCVYANGQEKSFVKGEPRCPDGDMPFVYAKNSREDAENSITWFYSVDPAFR